MGLPPFNKIPQEAHVPNFDAEPGAFGISILPRNIHTFYCMTMAAKKHHISQQGPRVESLNWQKSVNVILCGRDAILYTREVTQGNINFFQSMTNFLILETSM